MNRKRFSMVVGCVALVAGIALGYSTALAQERPAFPKSESVLKQALDDIEGKEVRLDVVTFAPRAAAPPHKHPGHVFVYVLEGEIVSQLNDGPAETFKAGDSFYEPTNGVHAVTRNPSGTEPAKILVMMIMNEGDPSLTLHAH
jgi:quercetin dioxygenase-like cupin family protein